MPKRYVIPVDLDLTPAERAAIRAAASLIKAEKEAEKEAKRIAKERAKEAEKAEKEAKKTADKKIAEAKREAEQIERVADSYMRKDVVKRNRHAAKVKEDAKRDAEELIAIEERYRKKDYENTVRYQARKEREAAREAARKERQIKKEITDEEVALAVKNKIVDNANKKRVRAALDAAGVERKTWSEAIRDATGFSAAMTKTGVALMALQAGSKIIAALGQGFSEAKQKTQEYVQELFDTAADLRELATIKEQGGVGEAGIRQHLAVRRASGLTRSEAGAFTTELNNALGVVDEKRLPPEERAKLEIEGAKMASRGGGGVGAVKARAAMLGMLPNYMGGPTTAKAVAAMGDSVDVILGKGSASQEVMTEQYRKLLTGLTSEGMEGMFRDPRQSAALTAITSGFEKDAPAQAALEAVRQVRKFTNFRKMKGMTASASETLEKAGIQETDDPDQSMRKLFGYAKKNMKKGEAFHAFLGRRGFRETESNIRLGQIYEQYEKGNYDRLMGMATGAVDQGAPERKFAAFAADPLSGGHSLAVQAAKTAESMAAMTETRAANAVEAAKGDIAQENVERAGLTMIRKGIVYGAAGGGSERALAEERAIANLEKLPGADRASKPFGMRVIEASDFGGTGLTGMAAGLNSFLGYTEKYIKALEENTRAVAEQNKLMKGDQAQAQATGVPPVPGPLRPAPASGARVQ